MKKVFFTMMFTFLSLILICGSAYAVTGQCSNCHTMHDSQDGAGEWPDGETGAQEQLLHSGCAGCHTGTKLANGVNSFGAPVVLDGGDPGGQGVGATNAGGDFWWVTQGGGDAKGHNVADITGLLVDGDIGETPPGWDPDATAADPFPVALGAVNWGSNQLTCAGTYGCHGNREETNSLLAVSTSHHNNEPSTVAPFSVSATSASAATTIANSYRFLDGIKGLENAAWNYNEGIADHNEYYGQDDTTAERDDDTTDTYTNTDTISYFCAQCHGLFHSRVVASGAGIASPWVRHPSDIVLPSTAAKEYDDYNSNDDNDIAGPYSLSVPIARPVVPTNALGSSSVVIPGDSTTVQGAIVMCLSCHRAHGSPEDDLLRFTYTDMTVGAGTTAGCFVCHTDKN